MTGPLRLRHRVGEGIARHDLWAPGDRVAVAVSGGLDSTVLADVLAAIRAWHGGVLSVVTVDHGTAHAAEAVPAVRGQAARLGLPLQVVTVHPRSASEGDLRDARYGALDALDVDRVAIAHHADDLAETVVLQLLRGTGVRGLAGMARRRGRYVRPLLDEPRAALEAWAAARGLSWVDDPTNRSAAHLRNRVRHEVMPLLEDLRPGAGRTIARAARHAAELDAWITTAAASHPPPWRATWIAAGPTPVVRRAVVAAIPGISAAAVDAIRERAALGDGTVRVGRTLVRVRSGSVTVQDDGSP